MTLYSRIITICLIIVCTLAGIFYYQASLYMSKNDSLKHEMEAKEQVYKTELSKLSGALHSQNQAIEIYQANLDEVQKSISAKENELLSIRLEQEAMIEEELLKDSSSDNQLKLSRNLLYEFSK